MMEIIKIFEFIPKGTKLHSPLCGDVVFTEVRPLNPSDERSPKVIVCNDVLGKPIFFNNEGRAIVWHPSGEMIYSTNMGECLIFPAKGVTWEDVISSLGK